MSFATMDPGQAPAFAPVQWKVEVQKDNLGKYFWKHVPLTGNRGATHIGEQIWDSEAEAMAAGHAALARHHEVEAPPLPSTLRDRAG